MFTFGTLVVVVSGFYTGCYGLILGKNERWYGRSVYGVKLECKAEDGNVYEFSDKKLTEFKEAELKVKNGK